MERVWVHERGHLGFGHRRLSIIDLKTGDPPVTLWDSATIRTHRDS